MPVKTELPENIAEIDDILIQFADVESASAISFRIGGLLTPEQVLARIAYLVEVPDRLTLLQQDQLITLKMRRVVAHLEAMMTDHRSTTRVAEVLLGGLEKVGARLDKRQAATEAELSTLYAFQGRAMLEAINETLDVMKKELTASGSGSIPEELWDAALIKGMRAAQLKVASFESAADDADADMVSGNREAEAMPSGIAEHASRRILEASRDYVPDEISPDAAEPKEA